MGILEWIILIVLVLWILGYVAPGTIVSTGSPPAGYRAVYGPGGSLFYVVVVILIIVLVLHFLLHLF